MSSILLWHPVSRPNPSGCTNLTNAASKYITPWSIWINPKSNHSKMNHIIIGYHITSFRYNTHNSFEHFSCLTRWEKCCVHGLAAGNSDIYSKKQRPIWYDNIICWYDRNRIRWVNAWFWFMTLLHYDGTIGDGSSWVWIMRKYNFIILCDGNVFSDKLHSAAALLHVTVWMFSTIELLSELVLLFCHDQSVESSYVLNSWT